MTSLPCNEYLTNVNCYSMVSINGGRTKFGQNWRRRKNQICSKLSQIGIKNIFLFIYYIVLCLVGDYDRTMLGICLDFVRTMKENSSVALLSSTCFIYFYLCTIFYKIFILNFNSVFNSPATRPAMLDKAVQSRAEYCRLKFWPIAVENASSQNRTTPRGWRVYGLGFGGKIFH